MRTISVRLSREDKRALDAIRKATGKSSSEVVREALREKRARSGGRKAARDTLFAEAYKAVLALTADEPAGPPTDNASTVSARVLETLEAKRREGRL